MYLARENQTRVTCAHSMGTCVYKDNIFFVYNTLRNYDVKINSRFLGDL